MARNLSVLLFLMLLCVDISFAGDNPKNVRAVRVDMPPRVDGSLDDEVWKLAEPAIDFIQLDPDEGKRATERSEIRVLYDNEALYFGKRIKKKEDGLS